jgi:hypothetical protein
MFKSSLAIASIAVLLIVVSARQADAQGFSFGGIKVDTDNQNNNQASDDEDKNQSGNNSNRQGGRRSRSNNSNNSNNSAGDDDENSSSQQIQQFFPGGQKQNGQNNNNNNRGQNGMNQGSQNQRRPGQQGNFPGNQQGQNLQNGQNWQNGQNGISIGTWSNNKWQGSRKIDSWTKQYGGNNQPFSSQWYKDHPKAWKYDGNNNNSNIYIGGTIPGLYGWLGWGNVPQQYRGNYGNNVQQFDRSHYGEWYPLGVYSLMAGPGDNGTRIVQLAVDQHGHISGNYYDMITGSNYSVSGDIRQQSQRASFALNKNQFVRFRAPVYQLLQPYGSITVSLPGGDQQWQFVRLEN